MQSTSIYTKMLIIYMYAPKGIWSIVGPELVGIKPDDTIAI